MAKIAIFALALLCIPAWLQAQFSYSEDFKNSTAAGWTLVQGGSGSTPGPRLTSGATPVSGDPEYGLSSVIDPTGQGWLRLATATTNQANAAYLATPIPSAGNKVSITFTANMWGGNNFQSTGADGLTFFLYDASKTFAPGAYGGSLGYAQKSSINGLAGGFVGIALDAYGNYSVADEGRIGGTTARAPNSVSIRGPGDGTSGYNYLAGTTGSNGTLGYDYTDSGSPTTYNSGTDGLVPALPYVMAFPNATVRPNQTTQYRKVEFTLDENSIATVRMQFGEDGLWYNILSVDLSSFARPEQLRLGFSAGTGDGTQVYEVGGMLQITATAGTGNFIWDNWNNGANLSPKVWGTGADDPLNWWGNTNPTLKSNVIFNTNERVTVAQSIDVRGSDKVVRNLYLSGPNSYTLSTSDARKIIFDADTGFTTLSLTHDALAGDASHLIDLDLQLNKNLDINNTLDVGRPLTIRGNIATGTNTLTLKGTGTNNLSGVISGAGSLVKNDTGTTILSGGSSNTYTGTTTINHGVLQIEKAGAFGASSTGTIVNSDSVNSFYGTLALGGAGTTFTAQNLTLNGPGFGNNGALRNVAGTNTWTGPVSLQSASSIGADTGTTLIVSGTVSGAAGLALTKVGAGTVYLSGANTYAGPTILNAGTLRISSDGASAGSAGNLGAIPATATAGQITFNGGTLQTSSTMTLHANRGIALGASGGTVSTDASTTLTYNGIIAGASGGALNKTGTGTLVLGSATASTYNGATNILAGTLQLGAANTLPAATAVSLSNSSNFNLNGRSQTIGSLTGTATSTVALGSGNTFTVGNATNTTFAGTISGSGTMVKTGTGTLTLTGSNSATGTLQIGAGAIQLGASNVLANTSTLSLTGGRLALGGAFSDTIGTLSLGGVSSIDYGSFNSTLTFTNASRSSGTLTIDNWAGNPLGNGSAQLVFTNAPTGFTVTSGVISEINFTGWGSGSIRLASGEIVPNTGGTIYRWANTSGSTWGTDGNWLDGSGTNPSSDPGTFPSLAGDTAILGSVTTGPASITLGANRTFGYLIIDSAQNYSVTGNNLLFNVGTGNAQIVNQNTGSATIASGIQLAKPLVITQNGTGTLTISGGITNNSGTNNLTVAGTGATILSGVIGTGSGSLTKTGTGTLTLSGANTFTGATTISGGTVKISAEGASAGNAGNLGAVPSSVTAAQLTLNGGTLETTATLTLHANRGVTLGAGGGTFLTDPSTTLTYGGIIAGTAGGALTKTGTGTLVLSGANTYNGATAINAGTLQLGASNRLPDTTAVTIANGATLNTNTYSETIASIAGAGTLALGAPSSATTFVVGDANNTLFSGNITGGGNAALTKTGAGTLTLTDVNGTSAFAGATTVNLGVLNIQKSTALGTTAGRVTVTATNAALELQSDIAIGSKALWLSGTGVSNNGALRNVSDNNSWAGALTLTGTTELQSDAGTLTLTGGITTSGANRALTLDGVGNITVSGPITTGTTVGGGATLNKSGSGTAILSGNNTYGGTTTISAGTLEIQSATALGATALGANTAVYSGATLAVSGGITSAEPLSIAGAGMSNNGALRSLGSGTINTLSGNITLAAESYVGVDAGNTLIASGVISGSYGLTKVGAGTLALSGANLFTGTTAINAGTLEVRNATALGGASTNPTTVAEGATLAFNNAAGMTVTEHVTLNVAGVSSTGAIQNMAGTNTLIGNVNMTGHASIGALSGSSLTLTGALSGAYNFVKVGDGALTLNGANTYSGNTTVRAGTLTLATSAPVSANGSLGNATSTVQIGDSSTTAANNLSLLAGGSGGLSIARDIDVAFAGNTVTLGGSNTSGTNTFSGTVTLNKDVNLTAPAGGAVVFSGIVSGISNITKTGDGTVTLSANNSFTGNTSVGAGTLVAASSNALGTSASTTTVSTGATFGLRDGIALPAAKSFTISGSGFGSAGAVNNISGDNSIAGSVTLAGNSALGSATAGDTLTLSGAITDGASSYSLTKTGAGNVTLAGSTANTYDGGTVVNGGKLTLAKTAGVNATGTGGITINSGGTVALGASNQISNSATLTLAAGGTFNTGGFSDTIGGLSLTGNASINFNSGVSSTLTFTNASRTGGVLTIDSWNGIPGTGGGGSQLITTNAPTGFNLSSDIVFTGFSAGAIRLASGEIVPLASGNTYTWNNASGSTWSTNANWTPTGNPNSRDDIAIFNNAVLTSAGTVNRSISARVGYLSFTGAGSNQFTITGSDLDLDVSAGNAQINVANSAAPTINANILLRDGLNVSNNSTGQLTIGGSITSQSTTAQPVAFAGTGTTVVNGVIGSSTNPISTLTKRDAGTLTLTGNNLYTGITTLREGTIIAGNNTGGANNALGTATTAVELGDASTPAGGNLALLVSNATTLSRNLDVNNYGDITTLGGTNSSGTAVFSGTVNLAKSVSLTAASGGTVNFTGAIANASGSNDLTKIGGGTVILSNTGNSYTGGTAITSGTLQLGASGVIPNASAVIVASSAVFDLGNYTETVGSLAGAGTVRLTGASGNTLTVGGNNSTTAFSGVIENTGAGQLALTKSGSGTLTLSGANTFSGATNITAGTIIAASNSALGSATGSTTVSTGATLGLQGDLVIAGETFNLAASNSPSTASLANLSGNSTLNGPIALTGATANDAVKIDVAASTQLTLGGSISDPSAASPKVLAKTGTGTLVLSGNNSALNGDINITSGTLVASHSNALGTSSGITSVQVGAALAIQGGINLSSEAITVNGMASPTTAALQNLQGSNTLGGNITLAGSTGTGTLIDTAAGSSLTLSGIIGQAAGSSSTYFVTKTGTGSLTLSGDSANIFKGDFTVGAGTVVAAKSAAGTDATGIGNVIVGTGSTATSATLQLGANEQINNNSNVTIQTDGVLALQGYNETVKALTMNGGQVTGSGTVTLGGNLTFSGVGASTAAISSNVDLGGNRIFQIGKNGVSNPADSNYVDTTISGAITGTGTLTKTDKGVLTLSGSTANTFNGDLNVADGTVILNKSVSGGVATGSGNVTIGDNYGAASSAIVQLKQNDQIRNTAFVSINSDGKLDLNGKTQTIGNFSGTGALTLGSGTLVAGDANSTTFSGSLSIASGGLLQKEGAGTLTIASNAADLSFTNGAIVVNNGTLEFTANALGTSSANAPTIGTLILNGGTLKLDGGYLNVTNLQINGRSTIDFGNGTSVTLDVTNTLTINGSLLAGDISITNWVDGADHFFAQNWTGATLGTQGSTIEQKIQFNGYLPSNTAWEPYGPKKEITPVPEPSTYGALLMGLSLAGLGYRRWRSRRQR